ncbi:MAG: serine acetyltransferase [Alkaliphilus sp.]|jgi:sugar O-acyltransferase (sialic acid O-acetyltransferase NeuD family)|nr:MAG: serine acetyltransferase [Alkaliphilus sp.]
MDKKILLIGGGGHCKSVVDSLLQTNQYSEIGIIDKKENIGILTLSIPVIGCDDDLSKLYGEGYRYAFITVGSIGNTKLRTKLFEMIEKIGFEIPSIIDDTAIVSKHVRIKKGVFVGKNAVINAGTFIGKGAIINTSATIEHDCKIEEFTHIAPDAVLCGEVQIGANTHIGARSVVKQQSKIGANTIIGMGSVVLKDVKEDIIAYGNPCKEVKQR